MQKVSMNNLKKGMKTYSRLCTTDGRVLLGSSIRLTDKYIHRIRSMGIHSVSVSNPLVERAGLIYEETLPEDKKVEAIQTLKTAFTEARKGNTLNVDSISQMAAMILDSVRMNQIIHLDSNIVADDPVYGHCLNVAALAAVIGNDMGYSAARMHELVMGALLHDIGKVLADGDVTEEDHPAKGFAYVRKIRKYSTVSAHVVYSHHENYDGSGFPRNLSGDNIHEYARITAVADAYDTLTSGQNPGGVLLPHEAYEAIMAMSGSRLDKTIADIFLTKAPLYPVGSFVVLNDAYIGIVTDVRPKMQARPTVLLVADGARNFLPEWFELKLTENLTSFISHVMSEEEMLAFTERYEIIQGK